ncbi:hypothetical protein GH714_037565 [Hevea brasiliensis]|uniref:Pre-rRNA-processing protein Ipi1 N-terminal domain-containing protein n=1 Tax=Hevea brasiliensis TaxID=3981 RepID=A0A6A6KMD1_HEVBR|nr:hypothetical protein GH714_037565 [Hevea brasiliensis]
MGLAVSKKGLTLKELLHQTSITMQKFEKVASLLQYYFVIVNDLLLNVQDALMGMKDLFLKYSEELKLHRYAVIEKLRERISDEDKMVREALYQLLNCFSALLVQDNQRPFISLMMAYIFNAMTHLAIEVRLMAFKFFDLIVQHYPAVFPLYAEKVVLGQDLLHAYEPEAYRICWYCSAPFSYFSMGFCRVTFPNAIILFLHYGHDDDRYFSLNVMIAEIFLHLSEWICPPAELLEKFLAFIEHALLEKIHGETRSGKEKQMLTGSFMPKLVAQVIGDWKSRLLQAFTKTFLDCKPESSVKLACLAAIEGMLFSRKGMWQPDGYDPEVVGPLITWIRELPVLLILLGDRHPSSSEAVLHLLLDLGRFASPGSFLAKEYDEVQKSLQEFYCTFKKVTTD